jgi:hypothetical protein
LPRPLRLLRRLPRPPRLLLRSLRLLRLRPRSLRLLRLRPRLLRLLRLRPRHTRLLRLRPKLPRLLRLRRRHTRLPRLRRRHTRLPRRALLTPRQKPHRSRDRAIQRDLSLDCRSESGTKLNPFHSSHNRRRIPPGSVACSFALPPTFARGGLCQHISLHRPVRHERRLLLRNDGGESTDHTPSGTDRLISRSAPV